MTLNKRHCGSYDKDNSPKAREILRLAIMALRSSGSMRSDTGALRFASDSLWIEQRPIWDPKTETIEICYYTKEPQKGEMLLKANIHADGEYGCTSWPHFLFYNKKESNWTLHQLHKLFPLEALSYFGREQPNG